MTLPLFIGLLFAYSLISARLGRTIITAPIAFTAAGMIGFYSLRPSPGGMSLEIFLMMAEVGLVLLLFTDASRTNLKVLRDICGLPTRLLSIGMLLSIFLGALAAKLVFPQISWWEAGILAAILAPTDAGLGQTIVNSKLVPVRVREALNVEAGLNDGLSVPFLLFFIAMAAGGGEANFMRFIGEQLGLGLAIGAGIGLAGGWMLEFARSRKWMDESFLQIGVVALPVFCFLACKPVGASPFIAAFAAGLFGQVSFKHSGRHCVEFTEQWGQILNLAVFFLFGMLVSRDAGNFGWAPLLYAALSLTVVRMLPAAISLTGAGLDKKSIGFIGWFGPRGLASIVLGLVYLEQEQHLPGEQVIWLAVMATVCLSIFAHGLSAKAGIRLLSRSR